jgi:hypothetical protein
MEPVISKIEIEFVYKGNCPKCGRELGMSEGVGKSFNYSAKILCRPCNEIFIPKKFDEATYKDNKLDKSIETRNY